MKMVENSPQIAPFLKIFLMACPQTPYQRLEASLLATSEIPEILKLGPPP